jgi:hypothetical protein
MVNRLCRMCIALSDVGMAISSVARFSEADRTCRSSMMSAGATGSTPSWPEARQRRLVGNADHNQTELSHPAAGEFHDRVLPELEHQLGPQQMTEEKGRG